MKRRLVSKSNLSKKRHVCTDLLKCVKSGNVRSVVLALESGANVTQRDEFGRSALHIAVCNGKKAVVRVLLKNKEVDVNAVDNKGVTVTCVAVCMGCVETLRLLLRSGRVDVGKVMVSGWTVLHFAAFKHKLEMLRVLVEEGGVNVDVVSLSGVTALWVAAESNFLPGLHYLVGAGADVLVTEKDSGCSVLDVVGNDECMEYLKGVVSEVEVDGDEKYSHEFLELCSREGFICGITFAPFRDPVTLSCGHHFERDAFRKYFVLSADPKCPLCRCEVSDTEWNARVRNTNVMYQRAIAMLKKKNDE